MIYRRVSSNDHNDGDPTKSNHYVTILNAFTIDYPFICFYRFTLHLGLLHCTLVYKKLKDEYTNTQYVHDYKYTFDEYYNLEEKNLLPIVIDENPFYFPVPIIKEHPSAMCIYHKIDNEGNMMIAASSELYSYSVGGKNEEHIEECKRRIQKSSAILLKANLLELRADLDSIDFFKHKRDFDVRDLSETVEFDIDYPGTGSYEVINVFGETEFSSGINAFENKYFGFRVSGKLENEI